MNRFQKSLALLLSVGVLGMFLGACGSTKAGKVKEFIEEGKHGKAERKAGEFLRKEPENKMLYYQRGRARSNLEKFDGAIADFNSALEHNEDRNWARWPIYQIGRVKMKQEEHEEAEKRFTAALEIKQDWLKALEGRAKAREEMGDTVAAEEDRKMIREIKVKRDRKRAMKAWNELTGGAPVKEYEPPVRGLNGTYDPARGGAPFQGTPMVIKEFEICKNNSSFQKARKIMRKLNGKIVEKKKYRDTGGDRKMMVTWKFTWWFDSHPDQKFEYYRQYKFVFCKRKRKEMVVYKFWNSWGHYPGGPFTTYYELLDYSGPEYEENDIFPSFAPVKVEK